MSQNHFRTASPRQGETRRARSARSLLRLLVLSFLAAPAPAAAQSPIVLSPGDRVRLTVWRNPELSGEFDVARDSTIRHPLYQSVRVAGIPIAEAEARLRELLQQFAANPQFVLEPLFRVSVGGGVREPSLYTLAPETTIAQAIWMAGGPTERGRLERVRLLRDGRAFSVDVSRPGRGGGETPVRSGDQIIVSRRSFIFRDYIAPAASITGAVGVIVSIFLR